MLVRARPATCPHHWILTRAGPRGYGSSQALSVVMPVELSSPVHLQTSPLLVIPPPPAGKGDL